MLCFVNREDLRVGQAGGEMLPLLAEADASNSSLTKTNIVRVFRPAIDYLTTLGLYGFAAVLSELNPTDARFTDHILARSQEVSSVVIAGTSLFLLYPDAMSKWRLIRVLHHLAGVGYETFNIASIAAYGILAFAQLEGTIFGIIANYRPDYVTNAAYYPPFAVQCALSLIIAGVYQCIQNNYNLPSHLHTIAKMLTEKGSKLPKVFTKLANGIERHPKLQTLINAFMFLTTLYSVPHIGLLAFRPEPSLKEKIITTGISLASASVVAVPLSMVYQRFKQHRPKVNVFMSVFNYIGFLGLAAQFYILLYKNHDLYDSNIIYNSIALSSILLLSAIFCVINFCQQKPGSVNDQDVVINEQILAGPVVSRGGFAVDAGQFANAGSSEDSDDTTSIPEIKEQILADPVVSRGGSAVDAGQFANAGSSEDSDDTISIPEYMFLSDSDDTISIPEYMFLSDSDEQEEDVAPTNKFTNTDIINTSSTGHSRVTIFSSHQYRSRSMEIPRSQSTNTDQSEKFKFTSV